ncbi:hypothetical protein BLNAU_14180 [Blattamonas nauphoetae]|uniref:Serine-threonine/tyrosine-protein kinase catalytic domain-containing protein n=1 Tax=Blattamonas nauphoetae TaxID=2049346 RepID=A0ABQ9XEH9_9EUKA|nr:hypothetical protein BLNAU_14180 [Blattamonas nauphoetae]
MDITYSPEPASFSSSLLIHGCDVSDSDRFLYCGFVDLNQANSGTVNNASLIRTSANTDYTNILKDFTNIMSTRTISNTKASGLKNGCLYVKGDVKLTLWTCLFQDINCTSKGTVVYAHNHFTSQQVITDHVICDTCHGMGSGTIYTELGTIKTTNSEFRACDAYYHGGAIRFEDSANENSLLVTNTIFSKCGVRDGHGGAISAKINGHDKTQIVDCIFESCHSPKNGAALDMWAGKQFYVGYCLFIDNRAGEDLPSDLQIWNTTKFDFHLADGLINCLSNSPQPRIGFELEPLTEAESLQFLPSFQQNVIIVAKHVEDTPDCGYDSKARGKCKTINYALGVLKPDAEDPFCYISILNTDDDPIYPVDTSISDQFPNIEVHNHATDSLGGISCEMSMPYLSSIATDFHHRFRDLHIRHFTNSASNVQAMFNVDGGTLDVIHCSLDGCLADTNPSHIKKPFFMVRSGILMCTNLFVQSLTFFDTPMIVTTDFSLISIAESEFASLTSDMTLFDLKGQSGTASFTSTSFTGLSTPFLPVIDVNTIGTVSFNSATFKDLKSSKDIISLTKSEGIVSFTASSFTNCESTANSIISFTLYGTADFLIDRECEFVDLKSLKCPIYVYSNSPLPIFLSPSLIGGTTDSSRSIYLSISIQASVHLSDSSFKPSQSSSEKGKGVNVVTSGQLTISTSTFDCCNGQNGGALEVSVLLDGTATISAVFTNCSSSGNGGALFLHLKYPKALLSESFSLAGSSFVAGTPNTCKGKGRDVFIAVNTSAHPSAHPSISKDQFPPEFSIPSNGEYFSKDEMNSAIIEFFESDTQRSSSSLLAVLFPPSIDTRFVHSDKGTDNPSCGHRRMPCQTLRYSWENLGGSGELRIMSIISLIETFNFTEKTTLVADSFRAPFLLSQAAEAFIVNSETLTLSSLAFTTNVNPLISSAILIDGGSLEVSSCSFTLFSSSTISGSVISGRIDRSQFLTIELTSFSSCSAVNGGAIGVEVLGGSFSIRSSSFESCSATAKGGAIFAEVDDTSTLLFSSLSLGPIAEGRGSSVFVVGTLHKIITPFTLTDSTLNDETLSLMIGAYPDSITVEYPLSLLLKEVTDSVFTGAGSETKDEICGRVADFPCSKWDTARSKLQQESPSHQIWIVSSQRIDSAQHFNRDTTISSASSPSSKFTLTLSTSSEKLPSYFSSTADLSFSTLELKIPWPLSSESVGFMISTTATLTLSDVDFSQISTGGLILADLIDLSSSTKTTLTSCVFASLFFYGRVPILASSGAKQVSITDTEFTKITRYKDGGAVWAALSTGDSLTLSSDVFTDILSTVNSARGGAVYVSLDSSASLVIDSCTFKGCEAKDTNSKNTAGGGICLELLPLFTGSFKITSPSFFDQVSSTNKADYGKDIFIKSANLDEHITVGSLTIDCSVDTNQNRFQCVSSDNPSDVQWIGGFILNVFVSDTIHLGGDNGNDEKTCGSSKQPCHSLHVASSHLSGSPLRLVVDGDYSITRPVSLSAVEISPLHSMSQWICQTTPTRWPSHQALLNFVDGVSSVTSQVFLLSPFAEARDALMSVSKGQLTLTSIIIAAQTDVNYGLILSTSTATLIINDLTVNDVSFSASPLVTVSGDSRFSLTGAQFSDIVFSSTDTHSAILKLDPSQQELDDSISRLSVQNVRPLSSSPSSPSFCSWRSGVVQLTHHNLQLSHSRFSSISIFGAILLVSSHISLTNCSFESNFARISSFPSAQHNIFCTSSQLTVTEGDWTAPESLWMKNEDCDVKGHWSGRDSFFFVPLLSASSCCIFSDTENIFTVEIEGSTLFPCGLDLEVFEVGENGREGLFMPFSLTPETTSSFSETHISLSLPLSNFTQLDKSYPWKARLIHSDNQRTPVSFSFWTPPEVVQDVVLVSSDGSDDATLCGGAELPCRTLFAGWMSRIVGGNEENTISVKIHRKTSVGSPVYVGAKSLTITHSTSSSDQLEGNLPTSDSFGMLSLEGGELMIHELMVVLGSSQSSSSLHHPFLVTGRGTFVAQSVRVESDGRGMVGMGLVSLRKGVIALDSVSVHSLSLSEGLCLLDGSADRDELIMKINNCLVSETDTSNASLIMFNSSNPSSSFKMSKSAFLSSSRSQTTQISSPALISVTTGQPSLVLTECVFEHCEVKNSTASRIGPSPSLNTHWSFLCAAKQCCGEGGVEGLLDGRDDRRVIAISTIESWNSTFGHGSKKRSGTIQLTSRCVHIQPSFFSECGSASRTTSLTNEPLNRRLLHLEVDAILSSTIQIRSDMISLKGRHTTLSFIPVPEETLNTPHFSQIRGPSRQQAEQSTDSNKLRCIATQFMFDVSNSTFWIDGMDLKSDTEGNGVCSLSGSSMELSRSSITSHGFSSPFVIVLSEQSEEWSERSGSTVHLSDVTYLSTSSLIAPFVDVSRPSAPLSSNLPTQNNDDSPDSADGISVVGMNVALESKMLLSGTGPLFSFGLFKHGSYHLPVGHSLGMETDLIKSHLFNISSQSSPSRSNSGELLFGSNVNQRLVGCSISRSSNHQRGTSMMDPNLGGSLLCQNTSFSSCVSQDNAEQEVSNENRVQEQRFVLSDTTITSIKFTLCTFDDMRWETDGDEIGGAAIFVKETNAALTVSQCFFHKCVSTGVNNDGTAILFICKSASRKAFSMSQSSFTECQSTGPVLGCTSSACFVKYVSVPTVTQCFFHLCNATGRSATLYFTNSPAHLTNSTFVKCASLKFYGGAIGLTVVSSVSFSSIQFRECDAKVSASADIAYYNTTKSLLNTSSIQYCNSTSGSPNIYDPDTRETDSTLIPQLTTNDGLFVTSFSMKWETSKCVVDVELSSSVVGVMGVLLEGGNVPRLIHVPFGSPETPSNVGKIEVSVGAQGVLPDLGEGKGFSIRSVGIAGKEILGRIDGTETKMLSLRLATLWVTGVFLKTGSSSIVVKNKNGETLNISILANNGTALNGTIALSMSNESRLIYGEEYWIDKLTLGKFTSAFTSKVSFIAPSPVAEISSFTRQVDDDWMTLSFSGSGLVGESYTLTLTEQNPSGIAHTKKVTLVPKSSILLSKWNVTLFPPSLSDLKYGTTYKVTHMISSISSQSTVLDTLIISTPPGPTRLTSVSITGYPDKEKKVEVGVSGVMMKEGGRYTLVVNETGTTTEKKVNVTFSSQTEGSGSATLFPLLGADLEYNTNYTVTSVLDSKSQPILFVSGLTFKTKSEPSRLVSTSLSNIGGPNSTTLVLESRGLTPNAKYEIFLSFSPTSPLLSSSNSDSTTMLNVIVTSETDNSFSLTLYPLAEADLVYGQTYVVRSMKTGSGSSSSILIEGTDCWFATPSEPGRLASIVVGSMTSDGDSSKITLSFSSFSLEACTCYTFEFGSSALEGEVSHTKTLTLTTEADGSLSPHVMTLFPVGSTEAERKSQFEFNRTYLLTSLKDSSSDILFDTPTALKIPEDPTRLTSVSITGYAENEKKAEFEVEGLMMNEGETYTLVVNETGTTTEKRMNVTFSSQTEGSGSATLFPVLGADLEYNTNYTVTSVLDSKSQPILFVSDLTFKTKTEPERLLSMSSGLLVSDSQKSVLSLSFISSALLAQTEYTLTLHSQPKTDDTAHPKTLKVTTDAHGCIPDLSAVLYPLEDEAGRNGQLEFDTTYSLSSLTRESAPIFFESLSTIFHTNPESPRIENVVSGILSKDRSEVTMILSGRALTGPLGQLEFSDGTTRWTSSSDLLCSSATECSVVFKTGLGESEDHLAFGGVYEVVSSDVSKYVVNSGLSARVPMAPRFDSMLFEFGNSLNTSCMIVFCGSDLVAGRSYSVVLSDSMLFSITVVNSSAAVSWPLAIGWTNTLEYSKTYTIESITPLSDKDGDVVFDELSFLTEAKPSEITLCIDAAGSESMMCGMSIDPCGSIEIGWWIVGGIGISSCTFSIVHNTTLKDQIVIGSSHEVVIRSGPSTKPELIVSASSASSSSSEWLSEEKGEGMIDVLSSRVWMNEVDVVLMDSSSVVFLRVVDGRLTLESCSITGLSPSSPNSNLDDFECSWSLGAFIVVNTTTSVTSSTFSDLSVGAINVEGGLLTIDSSTFRDNTPHNSSFPSARRNIHCSSEGQVKIGSLSGGDGSSDKHPHLWLSHNDCILSGADVNVDSPFFVPTLSSKSRSSFDRKNKTFALELIGSTLIPCGLFLEVFEVSKNKAEGKTEEVKLDLDSTTSFTETSISLTLSQSSLSLLDSSLEWRGRLLFGLNGRSGDSFVMQESVVDRRAQSVKENMKWWLPVVIVVACSLLVLMLIVFLYWRRRKGEGKKEASRAELTEEEYVEKMEEGDETIGRGVIETTVRAMKDKTLTAARPETDGKTMKGLESGKVGSSGWSGRGGMDVIEVIDCAQFGSHFVHRQNSLYNRLHVENQPLSNKRVQEQRLVSVLVRLKETHGSALVFSNLSSHWLKMNKDGEMCLLVEGRNLVSKDEMGVEMGERMEGSRKEPVDFEKEKMDGQRWSAPEQFLEEGEEEKCVKPVQVSVFRLGLVLWEIETGQIPFGETDAVNTCRQLKAGIVPPMDGVQNASMRDLITRCLSVEGDDRPTLESVSSTLNGIEEDVTPWKDTLLF